MINKITAAAFAWCNVPNKILNVMACNNELKGGIRVRTLAGMSCWNGMSMEWNMDYMDKNGMDGNGTMEWNNAIII